MDINHNNQSQIYHNKFDALQELEECEELDIPTNIPLQLHNVSSPTHKNLFDTNNEHSHSPNDKSDKHG